MTKLTRLQYRLRKRIEREKAARAPGFRLPGRINIEHMTPAQIAEIQRQQETK